MGQGSCRVLAKKSGYKMMLQKEADLSQGKQFRFFSKYDGKPFKREDDTIFLSFWKGHLAAIWRVECGGWGRSGSRETS